MSIQPKVTSWLSRLWRRLRGAEHQGRDPFPRPDTIVLTHHAVDRFQERFRPGLSKQAAREELLRLMSIGEIVTEPPAWYSSSNGAAFYLVIGGDLILLVQPGHPDCWIAATCIARGHISRPMARSRKRDRRRKQYNRVRRV